MQKKVSPNRLVGATAKLLTPPLRASCCVSLSHLAEFRQWHSRDMQDSMLYDNDDDNDENTVVKRRPIFLIPTDELNKIYLH